MSNKHQHLAIGIKSLSGTEKAVLMTLCWHANDAGYCYPSRELLADETCFNPKTVSQAIASLAKKGVILVKAIKGNRNNYQLNIEDYLAKIAQENVQKSCENHAKPVTESNNYQLPRVTTLVTESNFQKLPRVTTLVTESNDQYNHQEPSNEPSLTSARAPASFENENEKSDHEKIVEHALANGFDHVMSTDSSSIAISLKKGSTAEDWIIAMNGIPDKKSVWAWQGLAYKAEKSTANRLAGLPRPQQSKPKHDNQTYTPKPKLRVVEESEIIANLARMRDKHGVDILNFPDRDRLEGWEAIHGKAQWETVDGINILKNGGNYA